MMTRIKKITAIVSAILLLGTIIYQVSAYEGDGVGVGEPVVAVDGDAEGVEKEGTYLPDDIEDSEEISLGYFEDDDVDEIVLGEVEGSEGDEQAGYIGFIPSLSPWVGAALAFQDVSPGPPVYLGPQVTGIPIIGKPPYQSISIEGRLPEGWLIDGWSVRYSIRSFPYGPGFAYVNTDYHFIYQTADGYYLNHIMPSEIDFVSECVLPECDPTCNHDQWNMGPTFWVYLVPMTPPDLTKNAIYINDEAYDGQLVSEGDIITYRLRVNNPNPRAWRNFLLVDSLPAGLSLIGVEAVVPATALVADQSSGNTVRVVLDLPPGNTDVIFTARVDDVTRAVDGRFVNIATLYGPPDEGGERPPVDRDREDVPAVPPRVSLEKFVSSSTVDPGGNLTYRLVVRNTGGAVLTDVVVTDDLPAQLTQPRNLAITPAGAGTGNFVGQLLTVNIPRLGLGEEVTITFDVTVAANVAPGATIVNVSEVTTRQNVSDRDDARVTVNVPRDFRPPAQDDARVTGVQRETPLTGDIEITGSVLFMFVVGGTMLVMMSLIKTEKKKLRK